MNTLPILYSFRRCPYAIRARMALLSSATQVELREVDLKQKPQQMLDLSPKGTVPVLQLPDGTVLEESLDIMLWALAQADPEQWWQTQEEHQTNQTLALIKENDEVFKYWLDRYKYSVGYPEMSKQAYRDKGVEFIRKLDERLSQHDYLLSDQCTLADAAIFPFVRQFAFVDKSWFDASPYDEVKQWLSQFLQSERFKTVMAKYPPWQDEQPKTIIG